MQSYPLDSKGNVTTKGSISSRMLYWLGIKGKKNRKSIFLGIFANKSLEELIELLKETRTTYEEKQKINMVVNIFQINLLAINHTEFRGLLNAYDQLYMAKINNTSKITAKARTHDSLLRVLLERRTLLEEEIELRLIPTTLRKMVLRALHIIKSEQIVGYENNVQELNKILEDDIYIKNSDFKACTSVDETGDDRVNTTPDEVDDYNISIEGKTLIEVEPPFSQERGDTSKRTTSKKRDRRTTKRNYEREQKRNTIIGDAAEKMVLDIEKIKLISANRADLAKNVEHVSENKGDGLGYDIKSFETDGTEIFIEVKGSIETVNKAFFISESEVGFSREFPKHFYLYRVYDLNSKQPKYFKLKGSIENHFNLTPTEYLAKIK